MRYTFFGLFNFQAPYLPWILVLLSVLFNGSVVGDIVGQFKTLFIALQVDLLLLLLLLLLLHLFLLLFLLLLHTHRYCCWSHVLLSCRCVPSETRGIQDPKDASIYVGHPSFSLSPSIPLPISLHFTIHQSLLSIYSSGNTYSMVLSMTQTMPLYRRTGREDLNGEMVVHLELNNSSSCH